MDDKGTVKGVKAGEAKIKAVAQDGSDVESGISTEGDGKKAEPRRYKDLIEG